MSEKVRSQQNMVVSRWYLNAFLPNHSDNLLLFNCSSRLIDSTKMVIKTVKTVK